jgi:hypothetical protein
MSAVFKEVKNSRNSSISEISSTIANNQDSVLLVEIIPRIIYIKFKIYSVWLTGTPKHNQNKATLDKR